MKFAGILLIIYTIICTSCKSGKSETNPTNYPGHIIVPDKAELYNPLGTDSLVYPLQISTPLRIYTIIDVACASCMTKVEKWNRFKEELGHQDKVTIIPICITKNNFEILKYMVETDSLVKNSITFLLDTGHVFIKQNRPLISPYGEMTVLADKNDSILLTGNPLENSSDKETFIKKIAAVTGTPL